MSNSQPIQECNNTLFFPQINQPWHTQTFQE